MVSFDIIKRDRKLVTKIMDRFDPPKRERLDYEMDLIACHANGCALNFRKLLDAPEFDFLHDIHGIHRHLDRETGQLKDCFWPRCAKKL